MASPQYDAWVTADEQVVVFSRHVDGLRLRRADAARNAWQDPEAGAKIIAALDSEIAGAAIVRRSLWLRRMHCYQAHRQFLAAGRAKAKATRAKNRAAAAALVSATL